MKPELVLRNEMNLSKKGEERVLQVEGAAGTKAVGLKLLKLFRELQAQSF